MEWLLIPTLVMAIGMPAHPGRSAALTRFDRIARETGHTLVVRGADGVVRVGRLTASDMNGLTLDTGARRITMPAAEVTYVDRDGDPVWDGFLKGAAWGALLGAVVIGEGGPDGSRALVSSMVTMVSYGVIGAVIDRNHHGRTPVYRVSAGVRP